MENTRTPQVGNGDGWRTVVADGLWEPEDSVVAGPGSWPSPDLWQSCCWRHSACSFSPWPAWTPTSCALLPLKKLCPPHPQPQVSPHHLVLAKVTGGSWVSAGAMWKEQLSLGDPQSPSQADPESPEFPDVGSGVSTATWSWAGLTDGKSLEYDPASRCLVCDVCFLYTALVP
jgi:hypothetical protein